MIDPITTRTRLALLAILCLAAALRLAGLTLNSLWIDEFYSLECSAANCQTGFSLPRGELLDPAPHLTCLPGSPPITRIWTTLGDDVHPPLYYLLLRAWRETFGSSDAAVRSLSVLASLAALLFLFDLARHLLGPTPACWAAFLFALAQSQIWYAQEARPYALLTATLLGAAASLVRIETLGLTRSRAIALGGFLLAAMLTHYFAAAGCAAIFLYAAIRLRGPTRTRTLLPFIAAALLYLGMWGPFAFQQTHGYSFHNNGWLTDSQPDFLYRWIINLLTAPHRALFTTPGPQAAGSALPQFAILLLLPLPFLFSSRRAALLLPLFAIVALLGLPAALDLARHTRMLHFERYFVAAAPFLCLLAASLPALPRFPRLPHVLPATLALCFVAALPAAFTPHNLEWRAIGAAVTRNVRPGDVIVYHTPTFGDWYADALLLAVDHYASDNPARAIILNDPATPETLATLRAARQAWLITEPTGDDVPTLLPGFAPDQADFVWGVGLLAELVPTHPPEHVPTPPR